MRVGRKWLSMRFVGLFFVCLAGLFVFAPLLSNFYASTTSADDGPLIAWQVQQTKLAWLGQAKLYDQPLFYPYQNILTYSEPLVSSGLLAAVTEPLQLGVIGQYNFQLILGTIACLLATYALIKLNTKNTWLALAGATFFTFSLLRFQYVVHLHTYLVFGLPLAIFGWQKYVATQKLRYLILAAGCFLFQAFNNPMTAYALGLAGLLFLLEAKSCQVIKQKRVVWLVAIVIVGACAVFYWPYIQTVRQLGMPFSIKDAAHFSFSLNYLLTFDILLPVASLFILLGRSWQSWKKFLITHKTWWLVSLVGLVFMLGPVAKWHDHTIRLLGWPVPLPYAIVYYVLPGIQSIRSVTRFSILLALGISILLAQALKSSKRSLWQKIIVGVGLSLWVIVSARNFLPIYPIETHAPQVYETVEQQSETTLAVFPMYLWPMSPYVSQEDERLLYQLTHGKMLYNGVSGFMPPQRVKDILTHWHTFPQDESIALLKAAGIKLLLVQYGQYQQMFDNQFQFDGTKAPDPSNLQQQLLKRTDIEMIGCSQIDCLYKVVK